MKLNDKQLKTYKLALAEKYLDEFSLADTKLKASIKKEKEKKLIEVIPKTK